LRRRKGGREGGKEREMKEGERGGRGGGKEEITFMAINTSLSSFLSL